MTNGQDDASRVAEMEDEITLLESRLNNAIRSIDSLEDRVDELEKENDELVKELVEKVSTSKELEAQLSDAERIYHLGWDEVNVDSPKPRVRAMVVIENWRDWSNKGKSATNISFPELKEKLDNEIQPKVYYKTVVRVAEAMEELSDGKFSIKESSSSKMVYHNPKETPFAWELEQIVD